MRFMTLDLRKELKVQKPRVNGEPPKKRKKEEIRRKEALRLREEQQRIENEQSEKRYHAAYQKYLIELKAYEKEMMYYNEAMSLKRRFSHGGQFPNGAWFICFVLFLGVIFLSFFLSGLEKTISHGVIIILDIVILIGGCLLYTSRCV